MQVKHKEKRRLWITMIIIILFAVTLTGFRLFWIKNFNSPEQPHVTGGELDLRDWDFSEGRSMTLAGEWDFHPYTLLEEVPANDTHKDPQSIEVPGDWSDTLNPDDRR